MFNNKYLHIGSITSSPKKDHLDFNIVTKCALHFLSKEVASVIIYDNIETMEKYGQFEVINI